MGQSQSFYKPLHSYFPAFLQRFFTSTAKSLDATQDSIQDSQSRTQDTTHPFYYVTRSYIPSFLRLFSAAKSLEAQDSAAESKSHIPATIHSLPTELLLHMFSFLELRPYIFAHGVCTDWKRLLPLTDMRPTRRRLLDLYNNILETTNFQKSLVWALENLQPFDRKKYIDSLLAQYPAIPEEFKMWIMEWPERLVIGCLWPALPFVSYSGTKSPPDCIYGVNWLSYRPTSPNLVAPLYKPVQATEYESVPALLVWRHDTTASYLVFDTNNPTVFGRVFIVGYEEDEGPDIIPNGLRPVYDYGSDSDDDDPPSSEDGDYYISRPDDDWICYLENRWRRVCHRILHSTEIWPNHNEVIEEPIKYHTGGLIMCQCPAPLWDPTRR